MIELNRRLKDWRGRLLLLLILVPLLLLAKKLISEVPYGDRWGWFFDESGQHGYFDLYPANAVGIELIRLDLISGEGEVITVEPDIIKAISDARAREGSISLGPRKYHGPFLVPSRVQGPLRTWRVYANGHGTRKIDLRLPDLSMCDVVDDRYVVGIDASRICVLDLEDSTKGLVSTAHPNSSDYLFSVPGSARFFCVNVITPNGPVTLQSAIIRQVELFEIDDRGQPNRLATWPIGPLSRKSYWTTTLSGNAIASISPDLGSIQLHSTADGTLQKTFALPDQLKSEPAGWSFEPGNLFLADLTPNLRFFDLEREEWLPELDGFSLMDQQRDANLLLFRSSAGDFAVYDLASQEIASMFATETDFSRLVVRFANADSIAVMSEQDLVTVRVVNARSGETTHVHRPFDWVRPALGALIACYLTWCGAWLVVSAHDGGWAWLDASIVGGIPLALLTARVVLVGDTLQSDRIPYQYALGISLAAVMLSVVWVVFGKTRVTLRVLPFAMILAGVGVLLASVFAEDSQLAWRTIATTVVPSMTLLLPLWLLRKLGWSLHAEDISSTKVVNATESPERRTRFPLRDLFYATVAASLLFAAIHPIGNKITVLFDLNYAHLAIVYANLCALAVLLTSLHRQRWVCFSMLALAIIAVLVLGSLPVASFASGRVVDALLPRTDESRIVSTMGLALFSFLIPYRLRGWRFGRMQNMQGISKARLRQSFSARC